MRAHLLAVGLLVCLSCESGLDKEREDTAAGTDSGAVDSGSVDSGVVDTGVADTGGSDTGDPGVDTGQQDTGEIIVPPEGFGLLTLNLHCLITSGTSFSSNEARLAYLAQAVVAEDLSVLALQEACEAGDTSAMDLLQSALQAETGMSWTQHRVPAHTAWEGTADEAEEGVGLLVRGEIAADHLLQWTYYGQGGLTRVMAGMLLPPELGGGLVWSVHWENAEADARLLQAHETASVALSAAWPSLDVVVAGDLNDQEGSEPHQTLLDWGYRDFTADQSASRIDHVFVHRGAAWASGGAQRIFDGDNYEHVSDHDGYWVRLVPGVGDELQATTLLAEVDAGFGNYLAARGDTAPLDWEQGWVAWPGDDASWRLVLTELSATNFEYKWLLNDSQWQGGDNLVGELGTANSAVPSF